MEERKRNASSAHKMTKEEMKNENINNGKQEEMFLNIDDVNMKDLTLFNNIADVNMVDLYLNSFDETLHTDKEITKQPHFKWDSM